MLPREGLVVMEGLVVVVGLGVSKVVGVSPVAFTWKWLRNLRGKEPARSGELGSISWFEAGSTDRSMGEDGCCEGMRGEEQDMADAATVAQ